MHNHLVHSRFLILRNLLYKMGHPTIQGVQVQSEPFISSIALVPLVVRGCNIHFLIQKGGENDAQLLKL